MCQALFWFKKENNNNSLLCLHRIFTVYKICHLIFTIAWKVGGRVISLHRVTDEGGLSQHLGSSGSPEPDLKPRTILSINEMNVSSLWALWKSPEL